MNKPNPTPRPIPPPPQPDITIIKKGRPTTSVFFIGLGLGSLPVCLFSLIVAAIGKPFCFGFGCFVRPEWWGKVFGG